MSLNIQVIKKKIALLCPFMVKKLKKLVIKIPIDPRYKLFFDLVEKYEIVQIHRHDEENIFVTQKIKFKDSNMNPKMLTSNEKYGIYFVEILAKDKQKNEYVCFSKHKWFEEMKDLFKKIEIVIEPPIILENERIHISFLTDNESIDKVLKYQEEIFGNQIEIISITSVHPNKDNLFLVLTDRQRDIAFYAVQNGYYEIPRRIDSRSIAKHFSITQSALCEHLRKIEKIIFNIIFG